jgi:hypothetical protein
VYIKVSRHIAIKIQCAQNCFTFYAYYCLNFSSLVLTGPLNWDFSWSCRAYFCVVHLFAYKCRDLTSTIEPNGVFNPSTMRVTENKSLALRLFEVYRLCRRQFFYFLYPFLLYRTLTVSRFSFFFGSTQPVGLHRRVTGPSQGLYLNTGRHKHRVYTHTPNIHVSSGIRTYDPSVRASDYCDWSSHRSGL